MVFRHLGYDLEGLSCFKPCTRQLGCLFQAFWDSIANVQVTYCIDYILDSLNKVQYDKISHLISSLVAELKFRHSKSRNLSCQKRSSPRLRCHPQLLPHHTRVSRFYSELVSFRLKLDIRSSNMDLNDKSHHLPVASHFR